MDTVLNADSNAAAVLLVYATHLLLNAALLAATLLTAAWAMAGFTAPKR